MISAFTDVESAFICAKLSKSPQTIYTDYTQ